MIPGRRSIVVAAAVALLLAAGDAGAATTCAFETDGAILRLTGDCSTDRSIVIPDGMTIDGEHFTITAFDPPAGSFEGGIVVSGGATASVVNLQITALLGGAACHAADRRLRGVFFDGASGVIRGNTVSNVNQGGSRCNEGNAIEVRSLGTPVSVEIDDNTVATFQKSGIVVSGDVAAWLHGNRVGASATPSSVAANGVQVGFGATALVEGNQVAGNSWTVAGNWAATAVLLFGSGPGTVVRDNDIEGNADIGIHVQADGATVEDNRLFESGPDGFYDVGIGNYGAGNVIRRNQVRGYSTSYDGAGATGDPTRVAQK